MKWIFRLGTFGILAVAISWPFLMKNKQGNPMLELPSMPQMSTPDLKKLIPKAEDASPSSSGQVYYKWQDQQSMWHYSDSPPPKNAKAVQTVEVRSDTNVVQSIDVDKDNKAEKSVQNTPGTATVLPLPNVTNIMKDAELAREAMENRKESIDHQLEKNTR